MNDTHHVHAELTPDGRNCKVQVDGVDVENDLVGIEVVAGFKNPTMVLLHLRRGATLDIEGDVTVVQASTGVLAFLDSIDPDSLEARALEVPDAPTIGAGFLSALRQIAREAASAAG